MDKAPFKENKLLLSSETKSYHRIRKYGEKIRLLPHDCLLYKIGIKFIQSPNCQQKEETQQQLHYQLMQLQKQLVQLNKERFEVNRAHERSITRAKANRQAQQEQLLIQNPQAFTIRPNRFLAIEQKYEKDMGVETECYIASLSILMDRIRIKQAGIGKTHDLLLKNLQAFEALLVDFVEDFDFDIQRNYSCHKDHDHSACKLASQVYLSLKQNEQFKDKAKLVKDIEILQDKISEEEIFIEARYRQDLCLIEKSNMAQRKKVEFIQWLNEIQDLRYTNLSDRSIQTQRMMKQFKRKNSNYFVKIQQAMGLIKHQIIEALKIMK